MIKEAYVSFGLAQKLKEKSFAEPCLCYYSTTYDGKEYDSHRAYYPVNWNKWSSVTVKDITPFISRPTLQMTKAWLREEHLLHVYAEYKCFCNGMKRNPNPYYHWVPFIKPLPHCKYQILTNYLNHGLDVYCDTYEEACEKAIEYALDNLL